MDKQKYKEFLYAVDEGQYEIALEAFPRIYDDGSLLESSLTLELLLRFIPFLWHDLDSVQALLDVEPDYQKFMEENPTESIDLADYRLHLSHNIFTSLTSNVIESLNHNNSSENIFIHLKVLSLFPFSELNFTEEYRSFLKLMITKSNQDQILGYLKLYNNFSEESYNLLIAAIYTVGETDLWNFVEKNANHSEHLTQLCLCYSDQLGLRDESREWLQAKMTREKNAA